MRTLSEILLFEYASNIEEDWDGYMEEGLTITEGTTIILNQYKELVEESEEEELYLTLALIQLELEEVDERVKEVVNEIIEDKRITDYLIDYPDNRLLIKQLKRRLR